MDPDSNIWKYVEDLTVTNCEFGWIGGAIQHYFGLDPNYPEGGRGTVTHFGNAIEVYGGKKIAEPNNLSFDKNAEKSINDIFAEYSAASHFGRHRHKSHRRNCC